MTPTLKALFNTLAASMPGRQGAAHRTQAGPVSLVQKIIAVAIGLALFAVALAFSVLLFAAVLTAGAMAWGYLWWKTRAVRKHMRDNPPGGLVIEGEIIREVRTRDERRRRGE
jgi:hypothetical protein